MATRTHIRTTDGETISLDCTAQDVMNRIRRCTEDMGMVDLTGLTPMERKGRVRKVLVPFGAISMVVEEEAPTGAGRVSEA